MKMWKFLPLILAYSGAGGAPAHADGEQIEIEYPKEKYTYDRSGDFCWTQDRTQAPAAVSEGDIHPDIGWDGRTSSGDESAYGMLCMRVKGDGDERSRLRWVYVFYDKETGAWQQGLPLVLD